MKWVMSLFAIVAVGIFGAIAIHESGFDVNAPDWSGMTLIYFARAALLGVAVAALILIGTNVLFPRSSLKTGGEDQGKRADLEARIVENVNYLFKEALDRDLMPAVKQQIEAAILESKAPEAEFNQLRLAIIELEGQRDQKIRAQKTYALETAGLDEQQEVIDKQRQSLHEKFQKDSFNSAMDEHTTESAESGFDETAFDKAGDFRE